MSRALLVGFTVAGLLAPAAASFASDPVVLLEEDFEDGALDPRFSIVTWNHLTHQDGTPYPPPDAGIKEFSGFGSAQAFGFGTTDCVMDCFNTGAILIVHFDPPRVVTSLSFKEMEIDGNWGSTGGLQYRTADQTIVDLDVHMGNEPDDDGTPDEALRLRSVVLPTSDPVSELRFVVGDIAATELLIDDLRILGASPTPVNPTTWGRLRALY